ncbi:MAG TPA: hypothetical protein VJM11_16390 [Nevskiaceae bacterium]|nr:hypothetical protein [Nevskiaceae bacterium]
MTEGDIIMRWQYVDAEPKPVIHRLPFAALALREQVMAQQLRRRW